MKFLAPKEQAFLYTASLNHSGFYSLNKDVEEIWKKLVNRGYNSLLPGLLAGIIQKISWREAGTRIQGRSGSLEEQIFFQNPIWDSFLQVFQGLGSFEENHKAWVDALYFLLDYFDLGSSNIFSWGALSKFPEASVEGLTLSEQSQLTEYLRITDMELKKIGLKVMMFGLTEEFRIHYPRIFEDAAVEDLHRFWESSYRRYQTLLGPVPVLEEDTDNLVDYAEPEMQMTGGYCDVEIRGEGNWTALLASELSFEDPEMEVDYFDIKYMEGQLIFFKKDEGADRIIRRRIVLALDAEAFRVNTRALARALAWIQLLASICLSLYMKDRVQLILLLKTGIQDLDRRIRQLMQLRLNRQNPDNDQDIRFEFPVEDDGLLWQTTLITNNAEVELPVWADDAHIKKQYYPNIDEDLGLLLKTNSIQEKRLLRVTRDLLSLLQENVYDKVSN